MATCYLATGMRIVTEHAGVNTNVLTGEEEVAPLSGNAVLNGIPVTVQKALVTLASE